MKSKQRFSSIETGRLKLRKPLQKDANELLKITQDAVVMEYYGMPPFKNKAEALAEIEWFNKLFARTEGIRWVITDKMTGGYIGDIGFNSHVHKHARAEIGFKLTQAYWHQGIMLEALGAVLEYGFAVMQLNRIEAVVDPGNARCLGLLKRVGFKEEGLLREYEREEKGFVDLVMLSLLKREHELIGVKHL
jgi:[ribosomal protein S5]-alanine N-acetyltransferase